MNHEISIIMKDKGKICESSDPKLIERVISDPVNKTRCWDCSKGRPSKCEKIAHIEKLHIAEYPFVKKGFQVVRDGKLAEIAVFECENFCKHKDEPMSTSELRKLMEPISLDFYDTDDIKAVRERIKKNMARKF